MAKTKIDIIKEFVDTLSDQINITELAIEFWGTVKDNGMAYAEVKKLEAEMKLLNKKYDFFTEKLEESSEKKQNEDSGNDGLRTKGKISKKDAR